MRPTLLALEGRTLLSGIVVNNPTVPPVAPSQPGGAQREQLIVVNNPTDTPVAGETDLRQAIAQANSDGGDETINFDPTVFGKPRTIILNGTQLELSDTTGTEMIIGPAAGLTVSGGGLSRVFSVDANVTASIMGLTITGGSASGGGGVLNDGGTLSLTGCTVSGNDASGNGGGISTSGTTTITGGSIDDNFAADGGGGIIVYIGSLAISGTLIQNNTTGYMGGGIQSVFNSALSVINSTISGNTAGADGGGVFAYYTGATTLANCTVSGNSASNFGGGVYTTGGGTATVTNCTVSGNSASSFGGGVYTGPGSTATLTSCTVSGNSAGLGGGGLLTFYGTTTLTNCTVSGNVAGNYGGGLQNATGTMTLIGCTVSGNIALNGGGLENAAGTMTLTGCTVSGNSASVSGGAIFTSNGTLTLSNCTVASNTAGTAGGCIEAQGPGTVAQPLYPLLAPLGNYGGPTQMMALPDASLVNAGSSSGSSINVVNMFDALTVSGSGLGLTQDAGQSGDVDGSFETMAPGAAQQTSTALALPLSGPTGGADPLTAVGDLVSDSAPAQEPAAAGAQPLINAQTGSRHSLTIPRAGGQNDGGPVLGGP